MHLSAEPTLGLSMHDALLAELPQLRAFLEAYIAAWSADAQAVAAVPAQDTWLRGWLQDHHADLELSTAMGHYRVGDSAACARHLANYLDLSAGTRVPSRATALDLLARLELEAGRPDRARDHALQLDVRGPPLDTACLVAGLGCRRR